MGTSFVSLGAVGFWTGDTSLEVWLHYMVREINLIENCPPWLQELRDDCYMHSIMGSSGLAAPDLDQVVTSQERRDIVIAICERTLSHLGRFGEYIPVDVLNTILKDGERSYIIWYEDDLTEQFCIVGRYFIRLLHGEITTVESRRIDILRNTQEPKKDAN